MKHNEILLIGDVHGQFDQYFDLIKEHSLSLQVGDFGFNYPKLPDPSCHKFVMGNHDNYAKMPQNALYKYGMWNNIFYVSGAFSIDRDSRTLGIDFFEEEELSHQELNDMINMFGIIAPRFVVTHTAPQFLIESVFGYKDKTRTKMALQTAFEFHQPEQWFFGHYHESFSVQLENTHFQCLNILETKILRVGS